MYIQKFHIVYDGNNKETHQHIHQMCDLSYLAKEEGYNIYKCVLYLVKKLGRC